MIALITFNSSFILLIEGLGSSNPWEIEFSGFSTPAHLFLHNNQSKTPFALARQFLEFKLIDTHDKNYLICLRCYNLCFFVRSSDFPGVEDHDLIMNLAFS